jgi:GNAT superfamily N-acetyltransferase
MQYKVRGATHDDVPGIRLAYLRSWRAAYEPFLEPGLLDLQAELRANFDWSRGIDATTAAVLVAIDDDGSVLGVVQVDEDLDPPRDLPEITMLDVDPSAWGSGISGHLLTVGLKWIADRGHSGLVSASSSSITGRGASTSGRAGSLIRTSNRRGTTSSG